MTCHFWKQVAATIPELDRDRLRVAELEKELRDALASGEVQPVFQPLVSATMGRITGVEALARWRGKNGPVSPEVFIPLAEKSGLIDALGAAILRASLREARAWPGFSLSVDVSPIQCATLILHRLSSQP